MLFFQFWKSKIKVLKLSVFLLSKIKMCTSMLNGNVQSNGHIIETSCYTTMVKWLENKHQP